MAARSGAATAAVVSAVTQASIVVTGAAVRLTSSGLGCDDWPTCTEDSLAPEWSFHGWVEFGNRLFSGVVLIAALVAWWMVRVPHPRRAVRRRWAVAVILGTLAQALIGALAVVTDLLPQVVAVHFLASMALLWCSIELVLATSDRRTRRRDARDDRRSSAVVGLAVVALVLGTLVTGTGPNSGDAVADRLDLDLVAIARTHAVSVWFLVAAIVWAVLGVRDDEKRRRPGTLLLVAAVAQGAVGYVQYGIGLPPGLVMVHIIGAMVVWAAALWFHLADATPDADDRVAATHADPVGVGA